MIKQIYHPYIKWEDWKNGLYLNPKPELIEDHVSTVKSILGHKYRCQEQMEAVIRLWPFACEHNLTNFESNRRAWLGAAACNIGTKITEPVVRWGWGLLTDDQRKDANRIADNIIEKWELNYISKKYGYAKTLF